MKLTFYVHPHRFVRATQFPMYRRNFSVESEKAAIAAQQAEVDHVGEQMLEAAIRVLHQQDAFLLKGITEDEVRSAEVTIGFAPQCPLPAGQNISPDQFFTLLYSDKGEILVWALSTMIPTINNPDVTYIKKKHR